MFDITTGQSTQVAQHDAPVKVVKWIDAPQAGILVTGSWDKTLKVCEMQCPHILSASSAMLQYWDVRSPTPVATVQLPERCYTLDVQYPLMVVGTAERHIQIYNLTNPSAPYKVVQTIQLLPHVHQLPIIVYTVSTQVADASCFVLHRFYKQWVCSGKRRGQSCHSVCYSLVMFRYLA